MSQTIPSKIVRNPAGCPGWKSRMNRKPVAMRNNVIATYAIGEKK
jgi:hypothetical protein